jgi:hypothetical protein
MQKGKKFSHKYFCISLDLEVFMFLFRKNKYL